MSERAPVLNQIVLADDDVDQGILFSHILKKVDATKQLSIVRDGAALLNHLSRQVPELLFLDLKMPSKNGLECLEEIRLNSDFDAMKIVVYSSSSGMNNIQKCYAFKANLYMVKPFSTEHLKNALQTVLKKEWWKAPSFTNQYFINNRFVPFTG